MPAHIKYPVIEGQKQCGSCQAWKSISEFQRARTHYEASCRNCKKVYAQGYRQRPEVKKHTCVYHKQYLEVKDNRLKANILQRRYNKKPEKKLKRNATRRAWTAQEKQKAVDYKGGECQICGYSTCLAALDFHHPDPTQKEGYGTGALKTHWTFEKNKTEIDKCVLVCVRCHREIHAGVTRCPSLS